MGQPDPALDIWPTDDVGAVQGSVEGGTEAMNHLPNYDQWKTTPPYSGPEMCRCGHEDGDHNLMEAFGDLDASCRFCDCEEFDPIDPEYERWVAAEDAKAERWA